MDKVEAVGQDLGMEVVEEFVLASSSPRRRDLLEEAGYCFSCVSPQIDEWDHGSHPELSAVELVRLNARRKAEAVALQVQGADVLAADTVVYCGGRLLGKPHDMAEARAMLQFLQGRTHEVLTGMAWLNPRLREIHEHVERTFVTFRELDAAAIDAYLQKVEVLDKAGAYAAQEHGSDLIERLEGSWTNVVGLPMERVRQWFPNRE